MSAGLLGPGQNLQAFWSVSSRISLTWCCTYCLQGLLFRIQHSTANESVQQYTSTLVVKLLNTQFTNRAKMLAPSNSRRGIVCLFKGATWVFDATIRTLILPLQYTDLRYTIQQHTLVLKHLRIYVSGSALLLHLASNNTWEFWLLIEPEVLHRIGSTTSTILLEETNPI